MGMYILVVELVVQVDINAAETITLLPNTAVLAVTHLSTSYSALAPTTAPSRPPIETK